ncbi:MAG: ATP-dependent DNA helicase, partial [Thermoplasmata archaeon]|nr:ATP-dependent DNA helicase [Thermoplasmata archaeon]
MLELFPYEELRKGQDQLQEDVRDTVANRSHLITHASTGIGKTVAVLAGVLPYALTKNKTVFFLTSKQSQHKIAIETLRDIRSKYQGSLRVIDIISKQDMCPIKNMKYKSYPVFEAICKSLKKRKQCQYHASCNNDLKPIISSEIFKTQLHTEELVALCDQYKVCPHMVALDLIPYSNVIVCDYNYLFSPQIQSTLFAENLSLGQCILIIDEAHNLPDRIRENMSSYLSKWTLDQAKSQLSAAEMSDYSYLNHVIDLIKDYIKLHVKELVPKSKFNVNHNSNNIVECNVSKQSLIDFVIAGLKSHLDYVHLSFEALPSLFLLAFKELTSDTPLSEPDNTDELNRIAEFLQGWLKYDNEIVRVVAVNESDPDKFELSYRFLDPSIISQPIFESVHSSILMSGTLSPTEMYRDILGLDNRRTVLKTYESPFPEKNRLALIVDGVTSLYIQRSRSMYEAIANHIYEIASVIKGNVGVFFTSYKFMKDTLEQLPDIEKVILKEKREMSKSEKEDLITQLAKLQNQQGAILTGVQGGSLSEGVDYADNILNCIIIVGVPLAPPNITTKALQKYLESKFGSTLAYNYAILYPALNKSVQASGRAIRSETDKAALIFMDERF